MAPAADRLATLSETQRERLESILLEFDVTWTPDALAACVTKLPSDDADFRPIVLLELVKIDLERQWIAGNELHVERYLVRFPELGTAATVDPELLLAEHQARELRGRPVKLEDFARRFPIQVKELQQLLNRPGQTTSRRLSHNASTDTSREGEMVETKGSPVAKSWSLPKEFGRYRILKLLGEGGMGSVYLAHDTELDRQVALKVPKFSGQEDPQLIERFFREARAAAKLQNRHICQVYDVGEIDGVHYISMAYIEGRLLSAYARNDRTQPERSVVLVVGRLARALQEAHALGVVHRDLKPANIMIDRKREPVIMDFGLARLDRQGDSRLTQSGMVLGTPAYMPPEQVSGEIDRMGPVTDIYSLGVILYELLTGHVPFEGSMAAVLGQIMTQEPPKPSEFRADLDPRLEQICLKMMAKQIEGRYGSMQEVADALADYLKRPVDEVLDDDPGTGEMSPGRDENHQLEDMFATRYAKSPSEARARTEWDRTPLPISVISSRFKHPLVVVAIAIAVLLPVVFGILILLRTPHGTLRMDVEDPNLKVSVDGQSLTIEGSNQPIRFKAGSHRLGVMLADQVLPIGDAVKLQMAEYDGEHRLEVSLDGATLASESFTIVKGDQRSLTVSLVKCPAERSVGPAAASGEETPVTSARPPVNATTSTPDDLLSVHPHDPDRAVASFILGIGGKAGIVSDDARWADPAKTRRLPFVNSWEIQVPEQYQTVIDPGSIPAEPFYIHSVYYPAGLRLADLTHLAPLEQLEVVVLDDSQLQEQAFQGLPRCETLKTLTLNGAHIESSNLLALSGCSRLERLELNGATLNGRKVNDSNLAILKEFPHLKYLNLNDTGITDAGIDTLVHCRGLSYLATMGTGITDEGLRKLRKLELKSLFVGRYAEDGVIADSRMSSLADFQALEQLAIVSPITNAGFARIAPLVARLRALNLIHTAITDEGLGVLSGAAKLEDLSLGSGVTGQGLAQLKNCPLRRLGLKNCEITDTGLRQLQQLTTLKVLALGPRAKVSEAALQEFRTKLPSCSVDIGSIEAPPRLAPTRPKPLPNGKRRQLKTGLPKDLTAPFEQEQWALKLNGKSDYMTIPSWKFLGAHPITVELVVEPHRIPAKGWVNILSDTEGGGLSVGLDQKGKWYFSVHVNGGYRHGWSDSAAVENQVVHLAAVWDENKARMFVDGKLQQTAELAKGQFKASNLTLLIGAEPNSGRKPSIYFAGTIYEARISRIARYTEDFSPQNPMNTDDNTILHFHLNEGRGFTASDSSGNEHDASIHGGATWIRVPAPPPATAHDDEESISERP